MQPALPSVKELLGNSGYRTYAASLNRHPITFHLAISDGGNRVSALVNFTCQLLRAAQDAGCDPRDLLDEAKSATFISYDERTGLEYALEHTIGVDASSILGKILPMARRDILHALRFDTARHHPHFRLIVTTALALKKRGVAPRRVVLDQILIEAEGEDD